MLERVRILFLSDEHNAEIQSGIECFGIDLNRSLELTPGFRNSLEIQVLNTEIIVSHHELRIDFDGSLVRLYRGEAPDLTYGGEEAGAKLKDVFGKKPKYTDVPGLCRAATLKEIGAQGWSLNPGRYVGVAPGEAVSDEDFKAQLETLNEELEALNAQARELEQTIAANVAGILGV